jgi:hypothetical protein
LQFLMVLSPFVFDSPLTALVQYQVQYQVTVAPLAPMRPLSQASVATEPFGTSRRAGNLRLCVYWHI